MSAKREEQVEIDRLSSFAVTAARDMALFGALAIILIVIRRLF